VNARSIVSDRDSTAIVIELDPHAKLELRFFRRTELIGIVHEALQ